MVITSVSLLQTYRRFPKLVLFELYSIQCFVIAEEAVGAVGATAAHSGAVGMRLHAPGHRLGLLHPPHLPAHLHVGDPALRHHEREYYILIGRGSFTTPLSKRIT